MTDNNQQQQQQIQYMQNILNNPTMMQQAFNGFMTSMMPAMMPQMMTMFANQMQNNLNQMGGSLQNAQNSRTEQSDKESTQQEYQPNQFNQPPTIQAPNPSQKKIVSANNTQSTTSSSKKGQQQKAGQKNQTAPLKFNKLSMYMIFNKKRFKEIKEKSPDMAFTEVSKQICDEYKKLTETQKAYYQKQADDSNKIRLEEFQKNGGQLHQSGKQQKSEGSPGSNQRSAPKEKKAIEDKKPMTPFMFYMQVRRAELRDPAHVSPDKAPSITEVTKIVSAEWKQLDEFKKKQFCIPAEVQTDMRIKGHMSDITHLRNAVLQNLNGGFN